MNKGVKWYAAGTVTAIVTILWPGPAASADTSLGGYTALAHASVVHAELFEPVIPIPGSPQGDVSVAYSRASVDTGPTSRAIASYLWPGDVLGDGLSQLVANTNWGVQVNSRYPATPQAPAKNTIQISDGNGMTTASTGDTTNGTVTLAGVGAPGTTLLGGLGDGLGNLLNSLAGTDPTGGVELPSVPVPLPSGLTGLASLQNVTSTSNVTVADKTVTSTAHAAATNISLLGGLIGLAGVDVSSTVVSDGVKATATGTAKIGGITILGQKLDLGDAGLNVAGTGAALPDLSSTLSGLLSSLGISLKLVPVTKTIEGASGEFAAQVLQVTIDTGPLKALLNGPLNAVVTLLGADAATQLAPVIELAPKIVLTVGDVNASAVATPAYDGGDLTGGTTGDITGGTTGTTTGDTTGGTTGSTGGDMGATTGRIAPNSGVVGTTGAPKVAPLTLQPSALELPALGSMPRFLVLGALIIAGALGWVLRNAAGLLFGGARNCDFGLATGVPDLRKG